MIGLLLRPALLLSGLLLLPVLLIHAQPYDDAGLRDFLTPPEDCPAPCFMGIRPGVTTPDEALAILDQHPWLDTYHGDTQIAVSFYRRWTDAAPAWIDHQAGLGISPPQLRIAFRTTATWGEVLLALGSPDLYAIEFLAGDPAHLVGKYSDLGLEVIVVGSCASKGSVYHRPVDLLFQAADSSFSASSRQQVLYCG